MYFCVQYLIYVALANTFTWTRVKLVDESSQLFCLGQPTTRLTQNKTLPPVQNGLMGLITFYAQNRAHASPHLPSLRQSGSSVHPAVATAADACALLRLALPCPTPPLARPAAAASSAPGSSSASASARSILVVFPVPSASDLGDGGPGGAAVQLRAV